MSKSERAGPNACLVRPIASAERLRQRPALIDRFYAKALGFVPYATVRDLDKLVVNPGHAPD